MCTECCNANSGNFHPSRPPRSRSTEQRCIEISRVETRNAFETRNALRIIYWFVFWKFSIIHNVLNCREITFWGWGRGGEEVLKMGEKETTKTHFFIFVASTQKKTHWWCLLTVEKFFKYFRYKDSFPFLITKWLPFIFPSFSFLFTHICAYVIMTSLFG